MLEWTCPRAGCKRQIIAYTERGLNALADLHIAQHNREDRERPEDTPLEPGTAIQIHKPKDYDTLQITKADRAFLFTRHIALDDKIVVEENND